MDQISLIDIIPYVQGKEGSTFWSPAWGEVVLKRVGDTYIEWEYPDAHDESAPGNEFGHQKYNGHLTTDQYGRFDTLDTFTDQTPTSFLVGPKAKSLPIIKPEKGKTWEEWIKEQKATLTAGRYEILWGNANKKFELIKWLDRGEHGRYCIVLGFFDGDEEDGYDFRSVGSRPFDDEEDEQLIWRLISQFMKIHKPY